MSSSSKKNKQSGNITELSALLTRMAALEEAVARSATIISAHDEAIPTSVDISLFIKEWTESAMLQKLYPPQEDGSRVYDLDAHEFTPDGSGFWPQKRNWHGVYLGGCEQGNAYRRGITIPMCIKGKFEFFQPQGLGFSNEDIYTRQEALNACSTAIIDFGGDELCLNYTPGLELVYLFAQGFTNVSLIQFPKNVTTAILKFDESERSMNVFGAHDAVTLRRRRQDYYIFLNELANVMEWTEYKSLNGAQGLEQAMINLRANFKRSHAEGIRVNVIDRIAIYQQLAQTKYNSDIGEMMRIALGMFLLCEMHTREFMDQNMPEWKHLRGEFSNLQLRAEKEAQILATIDESSSDADRIFHIQACIDFITYVSAIVKKFKHLD